MLHFQGGQFSEVRLFGKTCNHNSNFKILNLDKQTTKKDCQFFFKKINSPLQFNSDFFPSSSFLKCIKHSVKACSVLHGSNECCQRDFITVTQSVVAFRQVHGQFCCIVDYRAGQYINRYICIIHIPYHLIRIHSYSLFSEEVWNFLKLSVYFRSMSWRKTSVYQEQ